MYINPKGDGSGTDRARVMFKRSHLFSWIKYRGEWGVEEDEVEKEGEKNYHVGCKNVEVLKRKYHMHVNSTTVMNSDKRNK